MDGHENSRTAMGQRDEAAGSLQPLFLNPVAKNYDVTKDIDKEKNHEEHRKGWAVKTNGFHEAPKRERQYSQLNQEVANSWNFGILRGRETC